MPTHKPIRVLGPQFAPYWHRPQFRYFAPVEGSEGANNEGGKSDDDLGFPKDTKTDDMTPEQQAAYWKHQSKTQQKKFEDEEKKTRAYAKFGTVEDLQSKSDAAAQSAEQARLAALDDNQRAIETAKSEAATAAKAEGIREGAGKHLGTAVKGMLIALTKGADESFEDATSRVDGAIEFADLTKFIGDDGELDAAKVQTFAKSIGSTDSGGNDQQRFDLFESMQRQNLPTPGSTGSVTAMEQQYYDRLNPTKQ